ncbi:MAG: hypothetical protein K1X88_28130, partial [Nannocystaceae bacterium]|nr:hypothetical protein [Nannocystaceae bacterium]
RARRLLAAVAEPAAPATSRDDGPLGAVAPLPVTAPLESPPPGTPITATPVLAGAVAALREGASAPAAAMAVPRAEASGPTRLHKLAVARQRGGASLSIAASRGVLVGVASQPEAGLVRLVLDDVVAAPAVLASRPGVAGVRVRDVVATRSSVRITLALEPGWSFAGLQRTGAGAKVRLRGP